MAARREHPLWSPEPGELARRRRLRRARRRREVVRLLARCPTAPLRSLPDFLLLGAAKSGTTTLYRYLVASPHVAWALRKEALFFDRTFHRGPAWYRAFFPLEARRRRRLAAGDGPQLVGEGSPDYLFHPHAPARVARLLPTARCVVILRNPVDRAWSHYRQALARDFEPHTFEEAVEREEERLAGELERMLADERYHSPARSFRSYLARGRYMEQLERWLEHVPAERLLVLLTEDLEREPARTLERLATFLGLPGLPPAPGGEPIRAHRGVELGPMDPDLRTRLVEHFRPHNARLAEFLGRELEWDR